MPFALASALPSRNSDQAREGASTSTRSRITSSVFLMPSMSLVDGALPLPLVWLCRHSGDRASGLCFIAAVLRTEVAPLSGSRLKFGMLSRGQHVSCLPAFSGCSTGRQPAPCPCYRFSCFSAAAVPSRPGASWTLRPLATYCPLPFAVSIFLSSGMQSLTFLAGFPAVRFLCVLSERLSFDSTSHAALLRAL
jgi:hypothetical protein